MTKPEVVAAQEQARRPLHGSACISRPEWHWQGVLRGAWDWGPRVGDWLPGEIRDEPQTGGDWPKPGAETAGATDWVRIVGVGPSPAETTGATGASASAMEAQGAARNLGGDHFFHWSAGVEVRPKSFRDLRVFGGLFRPETVLGGEEAELEVIAGGARGPVDKAA